MNFSNENQALSWAPFYAPAMSSDGWKLAFESDSPHLVAGDTNGVRDAFVCILPGGQLGTNYCTANPNSTGQSASIAGLGSASLSAQTLSLQATNLPPGISGRFFFGSAATNAPFGDGNLCVSGMRQCLPVGVANAAGILTEANVFSVPAPALPIVAGATYHFQAMYRDPAAMLSGFNLTDGLTVTFVP